MIVPKPFTCSKNSEGKYFTLDEYKAKIETLQKDKNGNLIFLYAARCRRSIALYRVGQRKRI